MGSVNYIPTVSGGKDSIATVLWMAENNIPITAIVHVVTPWEFEQTIEMVNRLEKMFSDIPFIRLHPSPFNYWLTQRPVYSREEKNFMGFGSNWPSGENGRWCTREKVKVMHEYVKNVYGLENTYQVVGFAADECHRPEKASQTQKRKSGFKFWYPLIEEGITEAEALSICYDNGFDGGGLYELFNTGKRTPRLSCYCCPHQPVGVLKILRREFPDKWEWMLRVERRMWRPIFKQGKSVAQWDARFGYEDSLLDWLKTA